MLMSLSGGIEEMESLLGHFMPSLKISESHSPGHGSGNQSAGTKAGPVGGKDEQQDQNTG